MSTCTGSSASKTSSTSASTRSPTAQAVLLVEWGDAVEELLPDDRLRVELTGEDPTGEDESRRIVVEAVGPSWPERVDDLGTALAPWETAS